MAKRKFDPIDKEILRSLAKTRIRVTPSQIAKAINIHPTTAQRRLEKLTKMKLTSCKKIGNRTYCKAQKDIERKLKKMLG